MSKASDYATALLARPEFSANGQRVAYVTTTGKLRLVTAVDPYFSPEDALKFARWLNDTFGEKRVG